MKKNTLFLLITAISFSLFACNTVRSHDNDYLKDDASVKPLQLPPDMIKGHETGYNIPPLENYMKPSLVPPNSALVQAEPETPSQYNPINQINRFLPKPMVHASAQVLVLQYNLKRSWPKVGNALKTVGYRILDQDQSTHSYYILDKLGKGKALNQLETVYRVYLQKQGTSTLVSVLTDNNQPAPKTVATQILGNIKTKLH